MFSTNVTMVHALTYQDVDIDETGSISITIKYDDNPVAGGTVTLYQVANMQLDEKGDLQFAEVAGGVFAERADEVFRKVLALVDVSADIAYPAFDFFLRTRFHILLVEGVGHGIHIVENRALCDVAEEHEVASRVDRIEDLQ